jgi:hypothetical protein
MPSEDTDRLDFERFDQAIIERLDRILRSLDELGARTEIATRRSDEAVSSSMFERPSEVSQTRALTTPLPLEPREVQPNWVNDDVMDWLRRVSDEQLNGMGPEGPATTAQIAYERGRRWLSSLKEQPPVESRSPKKSVWEHMLEDEG